MGAVLDKFFGDDLYTSIIKKQSVLRLEYLGIAPEYLPTEVLIDILNYLNRNEVEKCQLVCRRWDRVIDYSARSLPLRLFPRLTISLDNRKNTMAYKIKKDDDMEEIVNPTFIVEKMQMLIFEKIVLGPDSLSSLEEFFSTQQIPGIFCRFGTSSQRDSEYLPLVHNAPKLLKYLSIKTLNLALPMKAFIYLLTDPSLFQQYCLPIELNIRAFFPYSTPVPIPQRMNSFFHVLGISHDIQMHKCFLYLALCDYKVMDVCERLFHAFCHEWYSGFPFKAIVFGIPFLSYNQAEGDREGTIVSLVVGMENILKDQSSFEQNFYMRVQIVAINFCFGKFRNHWNRAPIKRFLTQNRLEHRSEDHNDSRFDVYEKIRDDGWTLNIFLDKVIKLRPTFSDFHFLNHDNEKVINVMFTECALQ